MRELGEHLLRSRRAHSLLLRGRLGERGRKKKLTDAARWWASSEDGAAGGDITNEALAFFGLAIEAEEAEDEIPADAFEVWPENVETVAVFVGMETQWSCVATAKHLMVMGLRYEALRELWPACGVPRKRRGEVMRGLRVMELAALPLLNGRGGE